MKKEGRLSKCLLLIFGTVLLLSAGMVCRIIAAGQAEKAAFHKLEECVKDKMPYVEQAIACHKQSANGEVLSPYFVLKEQNPDFFGWLAIKRTELSYPVMYTPEEPEYYLRRDFEGKESLGGVPFLSASCREGNGNYLIYGHNMRNGSMFSTLLSYSDQKYWQEHPTIQFDTLDATGEYLVMGAFYAKVYQQDETNVFRFYQYDDLTLKNVFDEYVKQVQDEALYDTGVCAEFGDQLITLITCSYHTEDGRFVVVARKQAK